MNVLLAPTAKKLSIIRLCLLAAFVSGPAWATNWTGGGGGDQNWINTANWGGTLPGVGDNANISGAFTAEFTAATGSQSAASWSINNGSTLNVSGGSLSTVAIAHHWMGSSGAGTMNVTGGTVSPGFYMFLGHSGGNGTLDISGTGSYSSSGIGIAQFNAATGSIYVSQDGIYSSTANIDMNGFGTALLDLSDNADVSLNILRMGGANGVNATLNVANSASLSVSQLNITDGTGTETVNWTGGTISATTANIDLNGTAFQVGNGLSDEATLILGGNNSHVFADGLEVLSDGIYEVQGTSSGQADIAGDVTLFDGATLNYSVNPTVAEDTTGVTGDLLLGDITIALQALGDLPSLPEYEYVLFEFGDLYTDDIVPLDIYDPGNSDAVNTALLNANVVYDFTYAPLTRVGNLNNPQLSIVGNTIVLSGFAAINIPEPSTLVLLGLGAALLRRRLLEAIKVI